MDRHAALHALAQKRFARAVLLTMVMIAVYFGFILLIAFNKPLMGTLVARGLSLGILFGALVIVISWLLTWNYVRWTNRHYDEQLDALKRQETA